MRIIIVGAGAVGTHLAERLSLEGQDVVVIESDPQRASEIRDRVDALVLTGNGASATVLTEAEVARADLLIAVSSSDGANFLACHTAKKLGVKRTIARVQDPGLREGIEGLEVDVVIDPVESAAREIVALLGETGVSELIEFGGGQLALVGGTATDASPLVGTPLNMLRDKVNGFDWLATAVVRNGRTIAAHGDTTIREGDHLLLMVEPRSHRWRQVTDRHPRAQDPKGTHSRYDPGCEFDGEPARRSRVGRCDDRPRSGPVPPDGRTPWIGTHRDRRPH